MSEAGTGSPASTAGSGAGMPANTRGSSTGEGVGACTGVGAGACTGAGGNTGATAAGLGGSPAKTLGSRTGAGAGGRERLEGPRDSRAEAGALSEGGGEVSAVRGAGLSQQGAGAELGVGVAEVPNMGTLGARGWSPVLGAVGVTRGVAGAATGVGAGEGL